MSAFHPNQLGKGDQTRLHDYTRNLDFYNGKQWPGRRTNDKTRQLTLNYARTMIDKTTAYVMSGIRYNVAGPDEAAVRLAETALLDAHAANALDRLDYDTETDTAVLGDGAFRVAWSDDENRPIVTAPDVQGIFVWPKPHNLTDYFQVAHRYTLPADQVLATYGVALPKDTATVVERWTDTEAELWVDNAIVATTPNPYGVIPYIVFPNNPIPKQFWGLSDIVPLRQPATEMNRELSVLATIMELSGNPIAVLAGVDTAEDLAIQAGVTWTIPETARAYLLDLLSGGGVRLHIDYLDALYRTFHDLAEVPRTAFGDTGTSLSGVALQIESQPLLQKVKRKRLIRTAAYTRRAQTILKIIDVHTGTNHAAAGAIEITWAPPLPSDRMEDINQEAALVAAGLAAHTSAMTRLGVPDPAVEWQTALAQARELAAAVTAPTPPPP